MHPNVDRVVAAGRDAGLELTVERFPAGTRTAADAARAVGCEVAQIVKSLVFDLVDGEGPPRPVLALVSGANRLDEDRLAAAAGGGRAARVDADRVREVTGFPIGGVPPFGHPAPVPTYVDPDLLTHPEVWAAGGTPRSVFAVAPSDLVRVTAGTVTDLRA